MGNYASATDVAARLPTRTISTTSTPTTAQVDAWIDQTEARLDGELKAAGFTTPVTGTAPINVLKDVVASRVAARWLQGISAGTDTEDNALSENLLKEWDGFLEQVRSDPSRVAEMIGQSFGTGANKRRIRGYPTDNRDSKSIDNGDFDPVFTRKMDW